ncbi:MAG: response regulator [Lentisphaerae bacterium]|nr:response regulator [Lentisphaerota bacterium]
MDAKPDPATPHKASILVVEDESIVAKDIQSSLQTLGYRVPAIVSTGEDAVNKAGALRPDLVLMDIMLKGDMDGIEAAAEIRKRYKIPAVYLTAYTDENTLRRAKVSEAFGYLLKPFEDRELRITIEMALYKHKMELKLSETGEWLETTLQCIVDAVIATDLEGRIKLLNPVAGALTGWKTEDALHRPLDEVFCVKTQAAAVPLRQYMDQATSGGVSVHFNSGTILASRQGREIPIEGSVALIRDPEEQVFGFVLVFRDITERSQGEARERDIQERLIRSRRMESLGALAGGVAHDLNNILGPIVGYPDLIMKNLQPGSPLREDLEIIKNSAKKAVEVIRDLLALGRIGHHSTESLLLHATIETYLKSPGFLLLQVSHPLVAVEQHFDPQLPPVKGTEPQLVRLLSNLVSHAFDAMPEGGRLILSTCSRRLESAQEGFETIPPGDYVVLKVADTGQGIEREHINRLFEPFFVRKKQGTQSGSGLGLAVVYGVIKEHKGFVDVHSEAGRGTEFTLYLPPATGGIAPAEPPAVAPHGGGTILVVDDDVEQRNFAERMLKTLGYRVITAHNGKAAVDFFAKTAPDGSSAAVDLVLLDMIMADDFDGLDTYRKILEFNPSQKAIIVSGFAVTERIKEALQIGAGQYIQKPYSLDDLGKALRRELGR